MEEFKRTTNGFNYVFEKKLKAGEEIILKMPTISPNKRGINDIGWQTDGDVEMFGTLSSNPKAESTFWQKIEGGDEVNKTVSALKIINGAAPGRIIVRVILN